MWGHTIDTLEITLPSRVKRLAYRLAVKWRIHFCWQRSAVSSLVGRLAGDLVSSPACYVSTYGKGVCLNGSETF